MNSNNDDINITLNIHRHDGGNDVHIDAAQPVYAPAYTPPAPRPKKKRWLKVVAAIVLIFWALNTIGSLLFYGETVASTRNRQPLSYNAGDDINFYDYDNFISDEAGWLDYKFTVSSALDDFYRQTGILPYVYITNSINGSESPTETEVKAFAENLYKELFTDEAHLLFVYLPNLYMYSLVYDKQTSRIFDEEACSIFEDYVEMFAGSSAFSNSEFIETLFTHTAWRIMEKTVFPWANVIIFVLLAAVFAFFIIRHGRKYKAAIKDLEMKELLQIPLEKFGDPEMEELMKKYDSKA